MDTPSSVTYGTAVSRDLLRICLTIAALRDLDILSADIDNSYLSVPCQEKVWMQAGPEFGKSEGKLLVVKMALYGLKYLGTAFREFLAEMLDNIGFRISIADPKV